MANKKVAYLHTVSGRPAHFSVRVGMLIRVDNGRRATAAKTLDQIRGEQADDLIARKRGGYDTNPAEYGYIKVRL